MHDGQSCSLTFSRSPGWKQSSIIFPSLFPAYYQLEAAHLGQHLKPFWQVRGLIFVLRGPDVGLLPDIRRSICEKVCLKFQFLSKGLSSAPADAGRWLVRDTKDNGMLSHIHHAAIGAGGIKKGDISGVHSGPTQQGLISGGLLGVLCAYMVPPQYFWSARGPLSSTPGSCSLWRRCRGSRGREGGEVQKPRDCFVSYCLCSAETFRASKEA